MNSIIVVRHVGDLGSSFLLYAVCNRCLRAQVLDRARIPDDMLLTSLRARLRCRVCRSKDVMLYQCWDAGGHVVREMGPEDDR